MSRYKPTFKVPGPPRRAWNSCDKFINKKRLKLFEETEPILHVEDDILEEAALEYADEMRPRKRDKKNET